MATKKVYNKSRGPQDRVPKAKEPQEDVEAVVEVEPEFEVIEESTAKEEVVAKAEETETPAPAERPTIDEPVLPNKEVEGPSHRGLDIGTNMLVSASMDATGNPKFKMQRDAFYKIMPKSEVNRNSIQMSLEKRQSNYIIDEEDGSFIVVGEDALEIAIERHDKAERPLQKGVISPQNKKSLPMLKLIIKDLLGQATPDSKVVYSVPAAPVDTNFDIIYHTEIMGGYLKELGYTSSPINEAFAIALSELLDEGLTGVCLSYGAGMTNCVVIHQGDPLVEFSLTRSGDYIDQSVGRALDMSPSLIQQEKEAGIDLYNPEGEIANAISVYYGTVIKYTLENIAYELSQRKKDLPIFREEVPLIVSGGLTLANGFVPKIQDAIADINFPLNIGMIRRAAEPMTSVAHGCLLAAHL